MDLPVLGLWFVCALGSAVFGAGLPLRTVPLAAAAACFALVSWWVFPSGVVDVATVCLLTSAAAAWDVTRGAPRILLAVMTGGLAGAWTGVLGVQGFPPPVAVPLALIVPAGAAVLASRRPGFAPRTLRDESLLFVIALSLVAAALPAVLDGWQAAGALALHDAAPASRQLIPVWALVLTGTSMMLGACYSLWSRR